MNNHAPAAATALLATILALPACTKNYLYDRDAPESAAVPDEVSLGVLSTEPWTFDNNGGRIMRTEHFRIYTTERTPQLRENLADFLELSLHQYRTGLVNLPAPREKLDVYLMDSRPQWQRLTQQLMGERAESITLIQRGGFAARGIGVYYDLGIRDTLAIAAHEGWHQLVQRTFAEPLPIWLDEGMATRNEGFRTRGRSYQFLPWANTERYDQLRNASNIEGALIPLAELVQLRPGDLVGGEEQPLLTYYAQVWAFIHFLNEADNAKYRGALQAMITDAQAGRTRDRLVTAFDPIRANAALASRTGPDLLAAYTGKSPADLQPEYDAFIRQITRPGARDRIVAGESPL